MKEYFRKPYMTEGIAKHSDYMKAIPQRAVDVQGQIAPNIEFKKPYDYHPNTAQMIHYYANNLHYMGGDPVPPLNDPSLLPHAPIVETPEVPVEVYDKYTVVLLPFDGVDAATTFTDVRGTPWTANGDAQIDTAQQRFGSGSGLFDGTGDYLSASDNDAVFNLGGGNFTIDFWFRMNAVPPQYGVLEWWGWYFFIHQNDSSSWRTQWYFGLLDNAGTFTFYFRAIDSGTLYINVAFSSPVLVTNRWYHVAIVRNGNNFQTFLDGSSLGISSDDSAIANLNSTARIGCGTDSWGVPIYMFNGWIDEFRISKGIARWTANFTPPTKAY